MISGLTAIRWIYIQLGGVRWLDITWKVHDLKVGLLTDQVHHNQWGIRSFIDLRFTFGDKVSNL